MYYCRFEQIEQILYPDFCHGLSWRIPAFEEDGVNPGAFVYGGLVDKFGPVRSVRLRNINDDFAGVADSPGLVQLREKCAGMVVNVKCYHSIKLPDESSDFKPFFNGRRDTLYLQALKDCEDDLRIVFACSACGAAWSATFDEIYHHIDDVRMLFRLYKQINTYAEVYGQPWKYDIQGYEICKREIVHEPWGTREAIKKTYLRAWSKIDEDGRLIHVVGANVCDIRGNEVKDVEHRGTDFAEVLLQVAREAGFEDELTYESPRPEAYNNTEE